MDLAGLPCEPEKQFFYPVEFDKLGNLLYEEQWSSLAGRLESDYDLRDIHVVVHGWDKTPQTAERDYQDFICRFYEQGVREQWAYGQEWATTKNSVIVGIFWPSTVLPNYEDLFLIKPLTYFAIRGRADDLQKTALQKSFNIIAQIAAHRDLKSRMRLHLIGHSFGGRMIVKGLRTLMDDDPKMALKLFNSFRLVNIVLLLPALPARDIEDILSVRRRYIDVRKPTESAIEHRYSSKVIGIVSAVNIYNIYSRNDWANGYLFPMGELASGDRMECAIGNCGLPMAQDARVTESGEVTLEEEKPWEWHYAKIWNVDATNVISSHGDIYKGRVARLLWKLLRWPLQDRRIMNMFPPLPSPGPALE